MKFHLKLLVILFFISNASEINSQEKKNNKNSPTHKPSAVKLTEVSWHDMGCYKIEMEMGTVYFEKDNGVSGFKSFIDTEGNDWVASYLEPGPNGDFRGFPNSVGNFGHAGRDSGSTTTIVNGITEGDQVILESTNGKFTFQYWFFADRVAIKVLKSEGEYNFLLECVAGGTADAEDYFVTADGKKHIPTNDGEFDDFTPEWFYLGDAKSKNVLFLAKTPEDDAPNENHRQIRPNGQHNMDLYSFGRTGKEEKYQVRGMSGNEHICIIGFAPVTTSHNEIAAMVEGFLSDPFKSRVKPIKIWTSAILNKKKEWYGSDEALAIAKNVIQYQSTQGGFPKSTDLARAPLTPGDIPPEGRGRANSIDNDATSVPMEFLAKVISATGDEKLKASFARGLDYLFAAQYPNGGWPQFWPLRGDEYYSRITYNDAAMIQVMNLLSGVVNGKPPYNFVDANRKAKATIAIERGLDCILKTQVKQNGKLTAWCAQYDEKTLQPAWARKYEPPSLSGGETVGIIEYLMSIENPTPEIINAVNAAVTWLRDVAIKGVQLNKVRNPDGRMERILVKDPKAPLLWARFYELNTNRPIYLDRDSVFHYDFSEVGYERRSGYDYHGFWATDLLEKEYPIWIAKYGKINASKTKKKEKTKTKKLDKVIKEKVKTEIIEAENGKFSGIIDRHSCWHHVMLTDAPHSTHSGRGVVDTKNEIGSYIEVNYTAAWTGLHRITVRYTHIKEDPRPGELLINGIRVGTLAMPQTEALPAWKTQSMEVNLQAGLNIIKLEALNEGGLPNMDYIKVAEIRDIAEGSLPNIHILEAEDGNFTGKEDHHSCWNFIAQIPAEHSGFTGEGYVDTHNEVGSFIEVQYNAPNTGKYELGIRYVHGKTDVRPAEIQVNGIISNPSLAFLPTNAWTAWTTITTPIDLKKGNNTIRFSAISIEGLANIDHFAFTPSIQ
ncbi:pectate lyase [Mariniflexile litorale]|uniref:Pectate lyase n=1 Tax=Mariniflexile litorale TaxID=3045158 RepID=A0AAU7EFE6_9FLAO|nr:pectate lyase [Mariniflexile sp. KMM 9835]MDQ8211748.1 pectate lyase [Mariniflexile sp. KMM 9835]